MVYQDDIIQSDLKHIWHPCMQMQEFEKFPPLVVNKAQGSFLETNHGRLIDGISSWWCKSLGHGHPAITKAIRAQLRQFEHVIAANTTHDRLARLGEKLAQISGKQHVSFASDGSCAVEIAMKLCVHAKKILGQSQRHQFIALENAYHGETMATMAVSDLGIFKEPYKDYGVPCHFLRNIPYVSGSEDPLWHDCSEIWPEIEQQLQPIKDTACALIVEPLIQGAAGMKVYSADFLKRLASFAHANDIYLIADEIMTGIGRSGYWFACEQAGVSPDFICVSKGLTAGALPLSCVLLDHSVYELFYGEYGADRTFLHSHTHSANALAVSAALATLNTVEDENVLSNARALAPLMHQQMLEIAQTSGRLSKVRSLGVMAAAELDALDIARAGRQFAQLAAQHGALLRPIGNTLYWLPPLNCDEQTIRQLAQITLHCLHKLYDNK